MAVAAVFGPPGLLLVRRDREPFRGLWALPGGKLHYGEHLDDAVEREVSEESGLRCRFVELCGVITELLVRPGRPDQHYLLLVCRLTTRQTAIRRSDEGEVRWFRPDTLPQLRATLIPSDRVMLKRLVFQQPRRLYYRCCVVEQAGRYRLKTFR
ncbi:MAG: NUDIX domain-containing protein [candidate division WOR-3 bacterium]